MDHAPPFLANSQVFESLRRGGAGAREAGRMGKRGPKPDPVQIKQAKGNPGRRPLGDTPSGKSLPPGPPDWMNRWSKEEWRRLRRILTPKGLLIEKYRGNFEMLCFDFGMWQLARVGALRKVGDRPPRPVKQKKSRKR